MFVPWRKQAVHDKENGRVVPTSDNKYFSFLSVNISINFYTCFVLHNSSRSSFRPSYLFEV